MSVSMMEHSHAVLLQPNDRQLFTARLKCCKITLVDIFDKGEINSYDDFRSCGDGKTWWELYFNVCLKS